MAPQRAWKNGLVGATDTVACMIAFQSVTTSARTADGMAGVIATASVMATHRKWFKRFIELLLLLGLRLERPSFPARRPSAGAVSGRCSAWSPDHRRARVPGIVVNLVRNG